VVECLPSKREALSSSPSTEKKILWSYVIVVAKKKKVNYRRMKVKFRGNAQEGEIRPNRDIQ
jgi:hypothetical protein